MALLTEKYSGCTASEMKPTALKKKLQGIQVRERGVKHPRGTKQN